MAIKTLDEVIDELKEQLEEAEQKAHNRKKVLEHTADRLAEIGLIGSDPHARMLFVEGIRGI